MSGGTAVNASWTVHWAGAPAVVVLAALLVSVLGGWAFTAAVLAGASRADRAPVRRRATGARSTLARRTRASGPGSPRRLAVRATDVGSTALLRGGLVIGLLERAAVSLAILAGHPDVLAVVVAVKGLGRFAELRERPAAAERFVIGSLASLLWAAVVGYGALALLQ